MKKGFTLIELLAVIVVLAIIALIATPVVLSSIQTSKESADIESARGISKAAELYCAIELMDGNVISSVSDVALIDYKGTEPDSINLIFSEYCKATGIVSISGTNFSITPTGDVEIYVFACGDDLVDSRDGKTYETVQIGDQCWFAENLAYTTTECLNATWDSTAPHDACRLNGGTGWDQNEVLYQWSAAMNNSTTEGAQGLCPAGWYIPTDNEIKSKEMYLGMSQVDADAYSPRGTNQGDQLKSTSPVWCANTTDCAILGFNMKPVGFRTMTGVLTDVNSNTIWWSSTLNTSFSTLSSSRSLDESFSYISRSYLHHSYGHSVRCLLET